MTSQARSYVPSSRILLDLMPSQTYPIFASSSIRLAATFLVLSALVPLSAIAPQLSPSGVGKDSRQSYTPNPSGKTIATDQLVSPPSVIDQSLNLGSLNHAPTDIQLSTTFGDITGTGSIPLGELLAIDPDPTDQHTFQLVDGLGSDQNRLFIITGNQLYLKNISNLPTSTLTLRVEVSDGVSCYQRRLQVTPALERPSFNPTWGEPEVESQGLVGYGEISAHHANANSQGWGFSAIGNAEIAFIQNEAGFEIAATGTPFAGETATISEITLSPSQLQRFNLDSLHFTIFSLENSQVTISGYREGIEIAAQSQRIDQNTLTRATATASEHFQRLDEIVLTFHPAIEAAEFSQLSSSFLKSLVPVDQS